MDEPAQKPSPRRRFFRFGLRAFFVFVTLVACASAWIGRQLDRCYQERLALSHLVAFHDGRTVTVSFDNPFVDRWNKITERGGLSLRSGRVPQYGQFDIDMFRTTVTFGSVSPGNTFFFDRDRSGRLLINSKYKTGLTDADMPWINKLGYLQFLNLGENGITDKGLAELNNLPYLQTLNLGYTAVTDKGLAALSNFQRLRILDLSCTIISDSAIDLLANCRQLERLNLTTTNVTADGIRSLQEKFPNCKIEY